MGFVSAGTLDPQRIRQVTEGMACARHRGPDDTAVWSDDRVCFGFNRLSIIDIESSNQPLHWGPPENPDRYTMVFNGEIYNYVELRARLAADEHAEFRTGGDGEAIMVGYSATGPWTSTCPAPPAPEGCWPPPSSSWSPPAPPWAW